MYGSNGWVDGGIIFHQGDKQNEWSGYDGYFRLVPTLHGGEGSCLTTRQEPSPIDRTKMDTFPKLLGDGRGSRLFVSGNIHSPEGKKLYSLVILASDLIVQSGVVDLDVLDAERIMNLEGTSIRYAHTHISYTWFLMFEWNHRRHYDYIHSQYQAPEFKTRVRATDFRLRVKGSSFDLREKKPEVLGDPTQSDALVLLGAQVEGFKMIVVRGKILAQLTPLIIDPRIAYSQDGAPRIEIHVLELSQALVDGLGRMGVSAKVLLPHMPGFHEIWLLFFLPVHLVDRWAVKGFHPRPCYMFKPKCYMLLGFPT